MPLKNDLFRVFLGCASPQPQALTDLLRKRKIVHREEERSRGRKVKKAQALQPPKNVLPESVMTLETLEEFFHVISVAKIKTWVCEYE